jgi:putative endonuclease
MGEPQPSGQANAQWFVYILRCSDNSFYVGHTQDIAQRVATHNAGKGARWTASRRPLTLVYQEPCESQSSAMKRESQLKRWTRAKKEALISSNAVELSRLSACRSNTP